MALTFTGERFLASLDSPEIAYEHWHRYQLATRLLQGKEVLDIACGEGYGSALLAGAAASVVGVDLSEEAVAHARAAYPLPNLTFRRGPADAIPIEGAARFDAIVSFETIEHLPAVVQAEFLREARRLLRPGGLLLVSTPDKRVYSDEAGYRNEYHLREFQLEEFRDFLGTAFGHVSFLVQRVFCGSVIWSPEQPERLGSRFQLEHSAQGFRPSERSPEGRYLIALCSDRELPRAEGSLLVDLQDRWFRESEGKADQATRALERREAQLRSDGERIARLEAELARRSAGGEGGGAVQVARAAAGALGHPPVSIVIPVWNKVEYTQRCLEKIIENTPPELYEVVVVDNASTDATPDLLAQLEGDTKVIRNAKNEGFVIACNQGAAASTGKYVLFLNNDTTPQPGWLEALVATAEGDARVGAVGSKLVYPDGNLQEAGGIVFSDASGWNFGKGDDPLAPEYNQPCEVDYCSGASLMVRRDLFERLGGFDLRYAPAYYEDTDLCFGVRSLGFTVNYCPGSVVVHHEGVTAGTTTASGMKRYQDVNRDKFFRKWADELKRQPEPPSRTGRRPFTASRGRRAIQSMERGAVLVVDPTMPMYDKASGSLRLFRLLELMRSQQRHVTFIARNGAGQHAYRRPLEAMGVEVYTSDPERMSQLGYYVPGPRADLGRILGERRFDVAWLSFFYIVEQYLPWIRRLSPGTTVVADTVDVHFLREMREAELRQSAKAMQKAKETRERELRVYGLSDLVVTVTAADAQELVRRKVQTPTAIVPNVHPPHAGPVPGHAARLGLVFVGGFNHPPNIDAVTWFVREVLPLVRKEEPATPLLIVGSNPTDEVKALAGPGVEVTGFVPDTGPYLDAARISIAPLRYGAGMKGKVGEALTRGIPVVTTSIGAEGMDLVGGEQVLIADEPAAFAREVLRLHRDADLWGRLSAAGRAHVEARYGPEAIGRRLADLLDGARRGELRRPSAA
jgi:GT2 family glycosyltransferase/SAM-dependent methyltransferase/glycosyltransferase involved in cell wall biosynthesis